MTPLTLLYVPGDRPERIAKALASAADVVILDLEDAVVAEAKDVARHGLAAALASPAGMARGARAAVQIRVNSASSSWWDADLDAVAALPASVGVRLPKCEDPATLTAVAVRLRGRALHALVESARGVEAAYDLARCPGVVSLGLGEADLLADLGATDDAGLTWARGRLVTAAAAAGLPAPAMSVYTDVHDLDGLRRSCWEGRRLGFCGRAAIHPRQLDVIADVFRPTEVEVRRARQILAQAETPAGSGASVLPDGRFVDAAVLRQAHRTLALLEVASSSDGPSREGLPGRTEQAWPLRSVADQEKPRD